MRRKQVYWVGYYSFLDRWRTLIRSPLGQGLRNPTNSDRLLFSLFFVGVGVAFAWAFAFACHVHAQMGEV
jgi:hypothetical protein